MKATTYAPFAKPLYVMVNPWEPYATSHANTAIIWKRRIYTKKTRNM